jgi:ATP phosphoribosyltransferase regulatory subunit HisZ
MQVGLECIGKIDIDLMSEVLVLAKKSLETVSEQSRLGISHMGFLGGLLQYENLSLPQKNKFIGCISEKNASGLKTLCSEYGCSDEFTDKIIALSRIYGPFDEVAEQLRSLIINEDMSTAFDELEALQDKGTGSLSSCPVFIDLSIVNDISYYSGVIFQGYIQGVPAKVLSGGRYDELLSKFGKNAEAIGFAVYLDMLARQGDGSSVLLSTDNDLSGRSSNKTDEPSPCLAPDKTLRVATKFPNIARKYYQAQGREIDVIKLNGSIELAPILGLSDVIVDIVETGQTLLENDMKPTEQIVEVSARLISNKASYTFKHEVIDKICEDLGFRS